MSLKLSISDLEQLTPERVSELDDAQKEQLLNATLDDLREWHDRVNPTPWNSSRPPGSQPIWGRVGRPEEGGDENRSGVEPEEGSESSKRKSAGDPGSESKGEAGRGSSQAPLEKGKHPGRQPGMAGHSRNQSLAVSGEVKQMPASGVGCGTPLSAGNFVAKQGHLTVEVERLGEGGGVLGLQATNVKPL